MRTITTALTFVALGLGTACDDAPGPGPAAPALDPAAGDLVGLLPRSTLAVVEFPELASRWDEIRTIPQLASLQDDLLDEFGLDADAIPALAGDRAVLGLVTDESSRSVVPVAVLDPATAESALAHLLGTDGLLLVEARSAIWIGSASQARLVERIAAGDGTSIRQAVDFAALAERLPEGGLVRAALNPVAIREYLRRWAEFGSVTRVGPLAAFMAADLEAVELAGVRRDIVAGKLVTDIWIGIDLEIVPDAYERSLAEHRGAAVLPGELPADVLAACSFRTEAEASLAWLRTLAARDQGGPLRQLDFWIAEFEAWSGRNVETDIVDALGERGLLVVLEGEGDRVPELVVILDARDPARLEASLVDLRDWLADHIWGRTLGLVIPQRRDAANGTGITHGLAFWSPVGTVGGPVFQIAADRLVLATGSRSLTYGVTLAGSAATWSTPAWALGDGGPPDEIAIIRAADLARLVTARSERAADRIPWLAAVGSFLERAGEGRLRVIYDALGFRIRGELSIDARVPGG